MLVFSPPPWSKMAVDSLQCGQTKVLMFSIRPRMGTLTCLNMFMVFMPICAATG
ncbi:hypothetical protein D3C72_2260610 [compost metagenome]